MAQAEILDLADFQTDVVAAPAVPSWFWKALLWLAIAALAVVAGSRALWAYNLPAETEKAAAVSQISPQKVAELANMNVDDHAQIMLEGLDAQQRNALIPVIGAGGMQAASFMIPATNPAEMTALRCLTQAVYYEAAVEPMPGRRAVAQVVLNRVRHPAYPNSVCGVVYQGSERRTGCQFSFTCDGSLLRQPSVRAWTEAQAVAQAALAGYVEPAVGTATHYHADYVLPKWAFQLAKTSQIGRHIFYRFNGGWGKPSYFTARYAGAERIPALNLDALNERLLASEAAAVTETLVPGLTVAPAVTDRHAAADVGGRIDTTREWRLSIPDPTTASSRYRSALETTEGGAPKAAEAPAEGRAATGMQD
jgi:spore germination cell wall hydrolase CwlJ-like protein